MRSIPGEVLFEKMQPLAAPYKFGDDVRPLQLAFAGLFDEAAQAVYRAGADLDEVLLERTLVVGTNDGSLHDVPADYLGSAEELKKSVMKYLTAQSHIQPADKLAIVAIKIVSRRDELSA